MLSKRKSQGMSMSELCSPEDPIPAKRSKHEDHPLVFSEAAQELAPVKFKNSRIIDRLVASCQDSSRTIKSLTSLIDLVPSFDRESLSKLKDFAASKLQQGKKEASDPNTQVLLLRVLSACGCQSKDLFPFVINDLTQHAQLSVNFSRAVRRQILDSLLSLLHSNPEAVHAEASAIACSRFLSDQDATVRCKALFLSARACDVSDEKACDKIYNTICGFAKDRDPRVRAAALRSVLDMNDRGRAPDAQTYEIAVVSLRDDYREVREQAVELVWMLSTVHGHQVLSQSGEERTLLIDDSFTKICNMVRDTSPAVRTKACALLGRLQGVSTERMMQTLSKEQLNAGGDLKIGQPTQQRAGASVSAANGVKAEDSSVPEGSLNVLSVEGVNLLDSSAIGALTLGLEDKFQEVRAATIESMCELSLQSPEFATRAVDFLVDMFNDEIESVRVSALRSVTRIGTCVELREEQVHIVLALLDDLSLSTRTAVHNLLSSTHVSNPPCLHATVHALMANMQRYRSDTLGIYRCLAKLGVNHPHMAEFLVEDLLHLDKYLITPEQNVEDPYYVAIMIFLTNAARHNPAIFSFLPPHAPRHIRYLRDKHPLLIPELELARFTPHSVLRVSTLHSPAATTTAASTVGWSVESDGNGRRWVESALRSFARVCGNVGCGKIKEAEVVLRRVTKELTGVSEASDSLGPPASLLSLLAQSLSSLIQLATNESPSSAVSSSLGRAARRMLHMFTGVPSELCSELQRMVSLSQLLCNRDLDWPSASQDYPLLSDILSSPQTSPLSPTHQTLCKKLLSHLNSVFSSQLLPTSGTSEQMAVDGPTTDSLSLSARLLRVRKSRVELVVGLTSTQDKPIQHFSFVPFVLPVSILMQNMSDTSNLFIQVRSPDQSKCLFPVKQSHFQPPSAADEGQLSASLSLQLLLQPWTDSCALEVSVQLLVSDEGSEIEEHIALSDSAKVFVHSAPKK